MQLSFLSSKNLRTCNLRNCKLCKCTLIKSNVSDDDFIKYIAPINPY